MRAIRLGLALTLGLAGVAGAQLSGGQWRVQTGGGQRAVAAPPPAQAVVVTPGTTVFPVQPVAFNLVPAILMSDGTVWANFGFGFEPVVRSCGTLVVGQPAVVGGNGAVIQPARPAYTQPVPNQQTASQQMVAATQGQNGLTMLSHFQGACFTRDGAGRFFAFR
jgi:hypothetical protein